MLSNGRWRGIFSARSILSSLPPLRSTSRRAFLAFTHSHSFPCFSVRRWESSRTFTRLEIWPSRKRPCSQPHDRLHPPDPIGDLATISTTLVGDGRIWPFG